MDASEAGRAVIALNAMYGPRGSAIDRPQAEAWAHVLADIDSDGWERFTVWWRNKPDGGRFPPAPIDVDAWRSSYRRPQISGRQIGPRPLSADRSASLVRGIRESVFGGSATDD